MTYNSGSEYVNRGGSWDDDADDCRSASRNDDEPSERDDEGGIRIVLVSVTK
ncbi:MAG: hypothetical protein LBT05_15945 [Planctomycetaceae bacterium]|nr:hypothetical protein [Planctomycetaceae bacterium]